MFVEMTALHTFVIQQRTSFGSVRLPDKVSVFSDGSHENFECCFAATCKDSFLIQSDHLDPKGPWCS